MRHFQPMLESNSYELIFLMCNTISALINAHTYVAASYPLTEK
jgi:hypothetical protein